MNDDIPLDSTWGIKGVDLHDCIGHDPVCNKTFEI